MTNSATLALFDGMVFFLIVLKGAVAPEVSRPIAMHSRPVPPVWRHWLTRYALDASQGACHSIWQA